MCATFRASFIAPITNREVQSTIADIQCPVTGLALLALTTITVMPPIIMAMVTKGIAAIGGAAFAAAAYSTRAWETDSNEDNETLEIAEESSTDEMIQPETVSIEISDPVTADIAYTIDPLSPAESEAIDMASTENDEIVIEDIEYPDEGDIFQSDMQDVMDWVAGETMDIPLLDNAIYSDDTIVEDSQLFSI